MLEKPAGADARTYLKQRSVTSELSTAYRLGYASDQRDGLVKHLMANGARLESALTLGIIRKGEHGWHDLLRNRLIFPISDSKGQIIGFAGRVLDASLPKYINSPESPLYRKSSVLFGLDMALPAIRTSRSVIIVEGYFDHLALYRAGVKNVVATCGTALTATHTSLIARHASRVYTLFDSDSAGGKATVRAMELFLEQRLPAYVISLPSGEDPDSFLAKNPVEAFLSCRDSARPAFDYFIRSLLAETPADSVDSKVRILDELIPRFRKIADPVERDLYEKEICRLLGITPHAFRKRMGGMSITAASLQDIGHQTGQRAGDGPQETLLNLMGMYPEAREEVVRFGPDLLFSGEYLALAHLILATADDQDGRALSRLAGTIEQPGLATLLSRLLVSENHLADIDWRMAFDQCRKIRERQALPSMKDIAARLAVVDPGSDEYAELVRQADALRAQKSKL